MRRYSPYPHWPALILFYRADQARSPKAARQRESEEGIYFHEGVEKDDRAIGETMCENRTFLCESRASSKKEDHPDEAKSRRN
jgi:hypothetical protein